MPDTIPNLWSADINVNILTPIAVLRTQAGLLGKMTKGVLTAHVSSLDGESEVEHYLDLRAPALEGYRYRVLTASYRKDLVYPVEVNAECFAEGGSKAGSDPLASIILPEESGPRRASGEKQFIDLVGTVLHSSEVVSVIHSLLARSNEQRQTENPPTRAKQENGED
jgi:hypothetical protein